MNSRRLAFFFSHFVFTAVFPLLAAPFDWPRWRGPDLNGISKETGWSSTWPTSGPRQLWKASVGTGFSSFAVAAGRAYTMGNRGGKESVYCFDAATGAENWKHTYDCDIDPRYYDGGPSATPTVDGDKVYSLSRKGHLFCFHAATGKIAWQKNVNEELELKVFKENTPEWGYSGSPLVQGDKLVLNVGTAGAALDKSNGKVLWTTGTQLSGYSTHVPFNVGAETYLAVFGAKGAHAVALKDGKQLWEFPFETSYDVNAADPILRGNKVFISAGYGRGAAMFRFEGSHVTRIWENKNMRNHFNSCVLLDGHLYGMDGDHGSCGSALRCLEFETGQVKWTESSVKPGALMAADGKLIIMSEPGELIVAQASPESFEALARAQVMGGKCWTTPVLSHGRIYCRNSKGDVVCLDVSAKSKASTGQ
jgi:outer membrane protein assembly factor BamB